MKKTRVLIQRLGVPRLIMLAFLMILLIAVGVLHIPFTLTLSQCIVRVGINIVLALAMLPSIRSGIGMNFGLPLGIICGLLAGMISLEYNFTGLMGILIAMLISIVFSVIVGWLYGHLLNKVKGSEMMVGTYMGFSIVSLMCIAWMILPFHNTGIRWPMGNGLRMTITLEQWYDKALNELWMFKIGEVEIPTGLILTCAAFCGVMWLFCRSRLGIRMLAAGSNPEFSKFSGIDANRQRIIGSILSTVLGGIGIIIYAQGFGFYQLYTAPLMMAFPAVAAVLIGGATASKISVGNVVLGTLIFQSILSVAAPVASAIFPEGNLSEVFRTIISNGIILYALSKIGREE